MTDKPAKKRGRGPDKRKRKNNWAECFEDAKKRKAFLEYVETGGFITEACALMGVSKPGFFWALRQAAAGKEPYATFASDIELAKARLCHRLLDQHDAIAIANEDVKAIQWRLSKLDRSRFGDKPIGEVEGWLSEKTFLEAAVNMLTTEELRKQALDNVSTEELVELLEERRKGLASG